MCKLIFKKYDIDQIWVQNENKILQDFSFNSVNSFPQANIYIWKDFITNEKKLHFFI